jgi:D-sedoheptulose 7-phosphate isomerase
MVLEYCHEGIRLRERFFKDNAERVVEIARTMAVALARGGKIMLCGNGGSAADAQHLAAEFVNRFMIERPPLPALALTTDTSALTAIGNDYAFDQANVIAAVDAARAKHVVAVGLTGGSGGELGPRCHYLLNVPDKTTALIQEVHIAVGHMLCRLVDYYLFEAVTELTPYLEG